jgi:hypothetical protein
MNALLAKHYRLRVWRYEFDITRRYVRRTRRRAPLVRSRYLVALAAAVITAAVYIH